MFCRVTNNPQISQQKLFFHSWKFCCGFGQMSRAALLPTIQAASILVSLITGTGKEIALIVTYWLSNHFAYVALAKVHNMGISPLQGYEEVHSFHVPRKKKGKYCWAELMTNMNRQEPGHPTILDFILNTVSSHWEIYTETKVWPDDSGCSMEIGHVRM